MRTTRTIRSLALSTLAIGVCLAGWHQDKNASVLAAPQATITITQPDGVDDVVGEGDDFATTVLGDPWDMSQSSDILALHGLPGAVISDGQLRFTMQTSSASVRVFLSGVAGAVDVGKIGINYPIDTERYHWLSFRMYHPGGSVQVKWFYDRLFTPDRKFASSRLISVAPGWRIYVINLETVEIGDTGGGATGWYGQVQELDIIPFASPGADIKLDWVRLTADNPTSNRLNISWSGLSPTNSDIDFYLEPDDIGCDGPLIHTERNASESGSFTWQRPASGVASPANVAPGEYYVCARVGGSLAGRSSGRLTVNHAPVIHFTQPSLTSGEDYATDAGNPWDMNERTDVDHVVNGSYTVDGGVLAITVPASQSDVQVHLNVPTAIDSDRYHYLTYRLWFDYPYTFADVGQGTRIFWGRAPETETQGGWIYDYPGWQTYSIDLRSLPLDFGPTWHTADWTIFRVDPIANGTGQQVTVYLDDVTLTGDEKANTSANIEWQLADPDSVVTTMTLYYDDDQSGLDGTHIATLTLTNGEQAGRAMSTAELLPSLYATTELTKTVYLPLVTHNYVVPCMGACYTWYTSDVPSGAYYLYACMDDGYDRLCRYSETSLHINHP